MMNRKTAQHSIRVTDEITARAKSVMLPHETMSSLYNESLLKEIERRETASQQKTELEALIERIAQLEKEVMLLKK